MQIWVDNQLIKNGRFKIKKILGSGGFGITYSAIENSTGKLFVLKTLNQQQQNQADFQQRQETFVNEALRLAKCSHPHIVKVHEMLQEAGLWCMVMEYIDGQDLGVYINQHGSLPEDEALRYIDQIGQALEYVHQQELLHRDIKPTNILLRHATKEAVLIDFGLAREFTIGQIGSMTNARTEGYAPIEQYERRGSFGTYTDVYALAATLYTLLTGEVPFPAHFRKYASLPTPQQLNSKISDRVNNAIIQAMALEPQARLQTVGEFRNLLGIANIKPQPITPPPSANYPKLETLLTASQWKEADIETYQVMLKAVERQKQGWMRAQELANFPCNVLHDIDQIWQTYSGGKFGFNIHKQIWSSLGDSLNSFDNAKFARFGDCVGWRKDEQWLKYDDFTFNLDAPLGHFPTFGYGLQRWDEWQSGCWHLFPRLSYCM